MRRIYEIEIGYFEKSINPKTKSFREFPKRFEELKLSKKQKIAMYCTGGIRCEKASAYLKKKGMKNIFQHEGGNLNYLETTKTKNIKNFWKGECFVFDKRVTVDKNLNQGNYLQCYGCRRAIKLRIPCQGTIRKV